MEWGLLPLLIAIALMVFTIYMAIDANKRIKGLGMRFLVILGIFLTAPLGPFVYWLVRRKK